MALTNFGLLTAEQKTIWAMDLWKNARNQSFINKFVGKGPNAMVQHITELKKSEKGTLAVITLLTDLTGDGVAGDRVLEGNEEAMQTFDILIRLDQIRHANRHEGRMADQKSIVNFRENSRDVLAYWLSDRLDQMAFLTLGGLAYTQKPNGQVRVGSDLPFLEFAGDVTAPSNKRRLRWDGTSATHSLLTSGATNAVLATDTPTWELFVQLKAYAKTAYMRGIKDDGGEETYHAFLSPLAMAKLKMDANYMLNVRSAVKRGDGQAGNNLFTGTSVKIDGIYLHEFRHVPNTTGLVSGSKYGATGTVEGSQILFCGAQALAWADIKAPEWNEKGFDYENSQGISVGKIIGLKKPLFTSIYELNTTEDFGVINVYVAN